MKLLIASILIIIMLSGCVTTYDIVIVENVIVEVDYE